MADQERLDRWARQEQAAHRSDRDYVSHRRFAEQNRHLAEEFAA